MSVNVSSVLSPRCRELQMRIRRRPVGWEKDGPRGDNAVEAQVEEVDKDEASLRMR